jgi:FlgN protein
MTTAAEVISHLNRQLDSARRLLALVLQQGAAIRERDVEAVLARLVEIRNEMSLRETLESERRLLLERAGEALALPAEAVTLEALTSLMDPAGADQARQLSAELRGLLSEIAREHGTNRALMRQELAFVDHLVRLVAGEPDAGYGAIADRRPPAPPTRLRALDLQA